MSEQSATSDATAPLEDLMVAMDVVDTVRHRQIIVDRELNADARRERLLHRLREIYKAQGIEVTEAALQSGVDALEEERFRYQPVESGAGVALAKLYVRRHKWLRPMALLLLLLAVATFAWYFTVTLPQKQTEASLPDEIDSTYAAINSQATGDAARRTANEYLTKAQGALAEKDFSLAQRFHAEMVNLLQRVQSEYQIRIISRPNQLSGVWRVPAVNPNARNYYLIVEAIRPSGQTVAVPIRNEEDGVTHTVSSWGVRVSEDTFGAVAADKRDDGIIQGDVIGTKGVGKIEPEYLIDTSGATITEW